MKDGNEREGNRIELDDREVRSVRRKARQGIHRCSVLRNVCLGTFFFLKVQIHCVRSLKCEKIKLVKNLNYSLKVEKHTLIQSKAK